MLKQLRRKFVLVTMGIILVTLGFLFGLIYHFTKADMQATRTEALHRLEGVANQPGGIYDLPRNVELPYFLVFVNDFGEYVAAGYTDYDLNDESLLRTLVSHATNGREKTGVIKTHQLMYTSVQGRGGMTFIFLDISGQTDTLQTLIRTCIVIGVLGMGLFLFLSIMLARWMVRPVEKAWNQQKQFVSDASHELKTPLTVIISNAELLENGEGDAAQYTQNILTMSDQMRHLVEGLLELARADNGKIQKAFAPVSFSTLVSESILPFEPVYYEKGLQIRYHIQPDITVQGSDRHLRQVVEILLDNAGKYTQKGIVNVNLQKRGKQCVLSVSNPGMPIPEEDLQRIFERFYRADQARSRTGSFGLGLSIADTIVKEHRGRIWAISNPTGNCFFVELPCE